MGICSSKSTKVSSPLPGNTSSLADIHLQTKREFRERIMKEKESGIYQRIGVESIWGHGSAMENIYDVYNIEPKEIGKGHFGKVRLGKLKEYNQKAYAIKSIAKEHLKNDLHLLVRELEVLRDIDHPNIAAFYECYQDSKEYHFVLEYCKGKVLVDEIVEQGKLPEEKVKKVMFQILLAVNHLHEKGICHRDLKPDNFIYHDKEKDSDIKMIDFGLSKNFKTGRLTTLVGTPYYVAPDLFLDSYDERCDYWSVGVMMYVMLSGEPPFYAENDKGIFKKILSCNYSFKNPIWSKVSDQAKNLISLFLQKDPSKRLSIHDGLEDDWFHKINVERNNLGHSLISKELLRRLRRFRTTNNLQKEVIRLMVSIFNDSPEVSQLQNVFFYLDYLNNGTISWRELQTFLREIGEKTSDQEAKEIVESLHLRQSGVITYSEFIATTINKEFFTDVDHLNQAFKRFDIDKTLSITPLNIKKCFARFGFDLDEEHIAGYIKDFDIHKSGDISREEFFTMMRSIGKDSD